jgi:hypothetical protein
MQCEALYDFNAPQKGDLPFLKGDVITVLDQDGVWWKGTLKGKTGVFPSTYVKLLGIEKRERERLCYSLI